MRALWPFVLLSLSCSTSLKAAGPRTADGDTDTVTPFSDTDTDTDTDSDTDSDADTDSDTDSDTDADTDTGDPDALHCNADYLSRTPVPGNGTFEVCVTDEIACGDVVFATTDGGYEHYDFNFYKDSQAMSWLDEGDLVGPERVYKLRLMPDEHAEIVVETCDYIWLSAVNHQNSADSCVTASTTMPISHGTGSGWQYEAKIANITNQTTTGIYNFDVVVDTYQGKLSNYKMTVTCWTD
jgi:hypothetical protein